MSVASFELIGPWLAELVLCKSLWFAFLIKLTSIAALDGTSGSKSGVARTVHVAQIFYQFYLLLFPQKLSFFLILSSLLMLV